MRLKRKLLELVADALLVDIMQTIEDAGLVVEDSSVREAIRNDILIVLGELI